MWNRLWQWFGRPTQAAQKLAEERALALEREAQSLRLDLHEQQRFVTALKGELERQRSAEITSLTEAIQVHVEQLLTDVATPVAQLLTQAHLLEVAGKPIQAKDVLTVAKRLVRALEDHGLTLDGRVGEALIFDPDRHVPLGTDISLTLGQQAVIRFVGASYQGKVIKKAMVTGV